MLLRSSILQATIRSAMALTRRGVPRIAAASFAVALFAGAANATPIVGFAWSPPSGLLDPGTTEILVDLLADQSGGANAAFLTLGFETAGAITGVQLVGFGAAISASDSFFTNVAGLPALLGSAPASPGSFGGDVDFVIATLRVLIDPNAGPGTGGSLALVDLTAIAGSPALQSDGTTPIAADLSVPFSVAIVPEPGVLWLVGLGLGGLQLAARSRPRRSAGRMPES